jgi:hypothetical protein
MKPRIHKKGSWWVADMPRIDGTGYLALRYRTWADAIRFAVATQAASHKQSLSEVCV